MDFPEKIEGERIILKRSYPTFHLAEKLFNVVDNSRETLGEWLPWVDTTKTPEDEFNYLKDWCFKHWEDGVGYAYVIHNKENQDILGCIDIFHVNEEHASGEIGYWLAQQHTGKGYMIEALTTFENVIFSVGINRIQIRNDVLNDRSVAVTKRCKYHLDGTMRQDAWDGKHSRYRDTYIWSKLKSEWEKTKE